MSPRSVVAMRAHSSCSPKLSAGTGRAAAAYRRSLSADSPDIMLENDKSVSRQHVAVIVDPLTGTACLEVLAKKGVAVNGVRHTPADPRPVVATGDIVLVGKTTVTVFLKVAPPPVEEKKKKKKKRRRKKAGAGGSVEQRMLVFEFKKFLFGKDSKRAFVQ